MNPEAQAAAPPRAGRDHTDVEELANAVTHGLGAVLGVAALWLLVTRSAPVGPLAVTAVTVFGCALVLVYASSTLHHGSSRERVKRAFLLCDRCAIHLLIAGTYTPVALIALAPPVGVPLAAAIWLLAAIGISIEVAGHCRGGLGRLAWLPVPLYLGMGWLGLGVAGDALAEALAPPALGWLVAGGLLYTAGVAFYLWRRLRFGHAVWHLFAVAGSACHVWLVLGHVLPAAA